MLAFALILQGVFFIPTQQSFAEGPTDPAPEIQPKVDNENAGKKVLFDNTHGQTAGAADWVIDGAFSDFAHGLAEDGFYVKELRKTTPITYDDLKEYNVFVMPEANIPYKTSEQDALIQYVENGGSIFFVADHYNADRNKNRWDSSEVFNGYRRGAFNDPTKGMSEAEANSDAMKDVTSTDWLESNFGLRFRYNALGDIGANIIVEPEQSFGITEGVNTVAMHAGSTIVITDPKKAKGVVYLPETDAAWPHAVDQGVYAGGGVAEGPYAAIAKLGKGKAAFIGDSSPVEDATPKYMREDKTGSKKTYDGFKEEDDATFLINTINWLANQEEYTSFDQVEGLELDEPTPLLDFEEPAASTEPQPEPWSAPGEGYLWWDMSTFSPGAYGSSKEAEQNPTYSLVHQDVLPNAETFQIRVVMEDLVPGSTVNDVNLGIYVAGGSQVAKVQNEDGSWPDNYGYSPYFSMTADQLGRATKDVTVQIKEGTVGEANLRLRKGSSKLLTNAVTIDNVPAEDLPKDEIELPALSSIADARKQAENKLVTVEGVITTKPGIFGSEAFYLQDDTAGIYVYQKDSGFEVGDKVRISAPIVIYNTEVELTNLVAIEKVGTGELPEPKVVEAAGDSNQGELIRLDNVSIESLGEPSQHGTFEFDAVAGEKTTRVRVDGRTGIKYDEIVAQYEGKKVNISGVSSIYKGTYQLKPLSVEGFSIADVTAPQTEVSVTGDVFSTGVYSGEAKITLTASDEGTGVEKVEYRIGEDEWKQYEEPIVVSAEGKTSLQYRAFDKTGNVEEVKEVSVDVLTVSAKSLKKMIKSSNIDPKAVERLLLVKAKAVDYYFKKADHYHERGNARLAQGYEKAGKTTLKCLSDLVDKADASKDEKKDINMMIDSLIDSRK
ncbi:endonuclease [Mechercharimyces sp. CAU 1602]|nr:endonuclease [Mechercharimyces sp. CAU 1602]MCS1352829.1 endonuclease [Mechercharimyces sp. CAU 1602]